MHTIDARNLDQAVTRGHLRMGGANPAGVAIDVNDRYLELGGEPWLPVMGEFHYARYPARFWEEELLKLKAGGIQIVASYVFWIHHEEIEGSFDWEGRRDLRRFVELCGAHGLYSFPRIGPWCHGEARNGGHPDWVLQKGVRVSSTDPGFLACVRRLYEQIAAQLEGLYWKDGGPIVGIQLDNEHREHGPGVGAEFMLALKRLAVECGIVAPLYTQTGWGGAEVPPFEILPLHGGYPDSFWEDAGKREPSINYAFASVRDDQQIGTDVGPAGPGVQETGGYPFLTCELGPGMQVAYHRRPFIAPDDVAAITVAKLASGSNLPGYYVYHGGVNPEGRLTRMHECKEVGQPNDVPVHSYDFQAPLGEFGQVRDSFHYYLPLYLFLREFGTRLAPMAPAIPREVLDDPFAGDILRRACRVAEGRGFLFVNTHVRNLEAVDHDDVRFELLLDGETIVVPSAGVTVARDTYFIWPVNLPLGDALLKYATAQPLCVLEAHDTWFFCAQPGIPVEYALDAGTVDDVEGAGEVVERDGVLLVAELEPGTDCAFTVTTAGGEVLRVVTLTQEQARGSYEHGGSLYVSDADVLYFDGETLHVQATRTETEVLVYPPRALGDLEAVPDGVFARYAVVFPEKEIEIGRERVREAETGIPLAHNHLGRLAMPEDEVYGRGEVVRLRVPPDALEGVHDVLIRVEYVGDNGRLYVGGRFVHDHFCNGRPWEISLRHFVPGILEEEVEIRLLPLRADAVLYLDDAYRPDFAGKEQVLEIADVRPVVVYEHVLQL